MATKNTAELIIKAVDQATAVLRNIGAVSEQSMKQVQKNADLASRSVNMLKNLAITAGASLSMYGMGKWLIGTNMAMEQATIGFETMLGSAEKAKKFLEDLQQFAAKTPFEFTQLREASTRMLAFGFAAEEVLPTLRAIGDATSALGLGAEGINRVTLALGQMRAKSKVSAEEMLQLTEAGIPAWEILAKAMGKSTAEVMKLSEKGLIPAQYAIDALAKGMAEKFPNMMEKQSKTLGGIISNLKDLSEMAGRTLGAGIFEQIKPAAERLLETLNRLRETGRLEQWGRNIGQAFAFVADNAGKLLMALEGLAAGFVFYKGALLAEKALTAFRNSAFLATVATEGLTKALMRNPLGLIAVGIAAATPLLIKYIENWRHYSNQAKETLETNQYVAGSLADLTQKQNELTSAIQKGILPTEEKIKAQGVLNNVTNEITRIMPDVLRAYNAEGVQIDNVTGKIYGNTEALLKNIAARRAMAQAEVSRIQAEISRLTAGPVLLGVTPFIDESKLSVAEKAAGVIQQGHEAINSALAIQNALLAEAQKYAEGVTRDYEAVKAAIDNTRISTQGTQSAALDLADALSAAGEKAKDVAESLGPALTSALSAISESAATASASAKVKARGVLQDILAEAQKLADLGVPAGQDLASGITQALDLLPKAVYDKTGKAGKQLIQLLNDLATQAASITGEAAYKIENALSLALLEVNDRIAESRRNWVSVLTDIGREIGQAAGTGSEEAKTKITDLFEDLTAKAQEFADQGDPVAKALIQSLTSGLEVLPDAIGDITGEAGNRLLEIIKDITIRINKYTGDSSFEIRRAFRDAFREAARHAEELRQKMADLLSRAGSIYSRMQEDIAKANEDYAERVAEVNERLQSDIQKLHEDYQKQLEDTAERLRNWTGLFDEVPKLAKDSIDKMLKNLRDQVDRFDLFYQMLGNLSKRGVDEGLIAELRQMGPKAAPQVLALYQATEEQLKEYVDLWKTRSKLATDEATSQLEKARYDMLLAEQKMRSDAQRELDRLRKEWQKAVSGIRSDAESELSQLVRGAGIYGSVFMLNLIEGIKAAYPEFTNVINRVIEQMRPKVEDILPGGAGGGGAGGGGTGGGGVGGGGAGSKSPRYIFTPDYYRNIGGSAAIPARDLTYYGFTIDWDPGTRQVLVNGTPITPLDIDANNRAWVGIRQAFQDIAGREVEYDYDTGNVYVYHRGGQVSRLGPKEVPIVAEEGEIIVPKDYSIINFEATLERVMKRNIDRVVAAIEKMYGVRFEQLTRIDHVHLHDKLDLEQFTKQTARSVILEAGGAA